MKKGQEREKYRANIISITLPVVCYTAVFSVVTQRSSQGALRDDTKNGCVADYSSCRKDQFTVLNLKCGKIFSHIKKNVRTFHSLGLNQLIHLVTRQSWHSLFFDHKTI